MDNDRVVLRVQGRLNNGDDDGNKYDGDDVGCAGDVLLLLRRGTY